MNNQRRRKSSCTQQEIEAALLSELKSAEAKFKQAGPRERRAAEKEFRNALRRFSALVLDEEVPFGFGA